MSNFPDVLYVQEARSNSERKYTFKGASQIILYTKHRLHLRFQINVFLERVYDHIISYSFYLQLFLKKVSRAGKYTCQIRKFKKSKQRCLLNIYN